MISFRLTAEEYDRFRELCSTCGTRSVSELARAAINSLLKQPEHVPEEALESGCGVGGPGEHASFGIQEVAPERRHSRHGRADGEFLGTMTS
jgi:hypothetical protein